MSHFDDCFTKRYANFYKIELVKEKTRQVKGQEVFLGKFRRWKGSYSSSHGSNSKSVLDKNIKMKIMIKNPVLIKDKYRVELIDENGDVCDNMIVVGNAIRHGDLLCDPCKFRNQSIYLADRNG